MAVLIVGYIMVMTIWAFVLMGHDKRQAKKGERRIPEKRLWWVALLGGGIGAYAGMMQFRHKTKHVNFRVGFLLLAAMDTLLLLWTGIQWMKRG